MATITIAPYDPAWPRRFRVIGARLRRALAPVLGQRLSRIDHIGSTSVPGLAAKPIIDVQVSIHGFYPADDPAPDYAPLPPPPERYRPMGYRGEGPDEVVRAVTATGLVWAGDWCLDRRKWLFASRPPGVDPGEIGAVGASADGEAPSGPPFSVNLHVRREGCITQQQALLFRDYLRASASARRRYEEVKRTLAEGEWRTVSDYADAKGDIVWTLLREADAWSRLGWRPGPSDA